MVRLHNLAAGSSLSITAKGAGGLEYTGTIPSLNVTTDALGDIKLNGSTNSLKIKADGFGAVNAQELVATSVDVESSGSGNVIVRIAGGTLKLALSGSGNIDWYGTASVVDSNSQGSGSIIHH